MLNLAYDLVFFNKNERPLATKGRSVRVVFMRENRALECVQFLRAYVPELFDNLPRSSSHFSRTLLFKPCDGN